MAKVRKRPRGTTIGELLRETIELPDAALLGNSTLPVQSLCQILPTQAHSSTHSSYNSQLVSQPQLHSQNIPRTGLKRSKAPKKNKGRGPAKLPDEWGTDVKIEVTLNEDGQLFGVKEQYNKFISALGAIARMGTYLPLDYARWSDMPQENLDTVWKEVEANTTLPPEAKKIVLQTINGMWKDWKSRVKAKYFTPYEEDPEHDFSVLPNDMENELVDMDQLLNLVRFWKLPKVQDASNKNKSSRSQKKHLHRTGKIPFQLLRARMLHEGKPTTKLDVLIESRTCGKGLGSDPETAKLVEGINEALAKVPESERTKEFKDDLFTNALGEDSQGRIRCMGRAITPSLLDLPPGFLVKPATTAAAVIPTASSEDTLGNQSSMSDQENEFLPYSRKRMWPEFEILATSPPQPQPPSPPPPAAPRHSGRRPRTRSTTQICGQELGTNNQISKCSIPPSDRGISSPKKSTSNAHNVDEAIINTSPTTEIPIYPEILLQVENSLKNMSKSDLVLTTQEIYVKHGEITKDSSLASDNMRIFVWTEICKVVQDLKITRLKDIELRSLESYYTIVRDAETMKVNVKWLLGRLDEIKEAVKCADEEKDLMEEKNRLLEISIGEIKQDLENRKSEIQKLEDQLAREMVEAQELNSKIVRFSQLQHTFLADGLI